jgi:microcystin-dependent protein
MADFFIGEIRLLPYQFPPLGWFDCNGSTYPISQYQALAAIIGTRYGGDGKTTFAVPDLRTRVAVGYGDDPTDIFDPTLASHGGQNTVTLTTSNMPPHNHVLNGATLGAKLRTASPAGNYISAVGRVPASPPFENTYAFVADQTGGTNVALNPASLSAFAGSGGAHENRQPLLALRYCICWDGIWPERP